MKVGLLLEGGAIRGLYTASVLDELNIKRVEKNENKLQEMYDLGIKDCKDKIKDLKEYLLK